MNSYPRVLNAVNYLMRVPRRRRRAARAIDHIDTLASRLETSREISCWPGQQRVHASRNIKFIRLFTISRIVVFKYSFSRFSDSRSRVGMCEHVRIRTNANDPNTACSHISRHEQGSLHWILVAFHSSSLR